MGGIVLAYDEQLTNIVTHINSFIIANEAMPTHTIYLGCRYKQWYIDNGGDDIVIEYGSQSINLGKMIDKVVSFTITEEIGVLTVTISRHAITYI